MNAGLHAWAISTLDVLDERETRRGYQVYATCPFCGKGSEHFSLNTDTGVYGCYICGDGHSGKGGGSYVDLVLHFEAIDTTKCYNWYDRRELVDDFLLEYVDNLSIGELESIYSKSQQEEEKAEQEYRVKSITDAVEGTVSLFADHPTAVQGRIYLFDNRDLSEKVALDLGICVGVEGLYKGRVIIPVWEDNKILSFTARSFDGSDPRYLGPRVGSGWVPRSETVFGLERISEWGELVVVEGVFDAMALWGENAVSILGKSLSPTQLNKIVKKRPRKVTVLLDAGTAKDTMVTLKKLVGFVEDIQIAMILEPDADPSSHPALAKEAIRNSMSFFDLPAKFRGGLTT